MPNTQASNTQASNDGGAPAFRPLPAVGDVAELTRVVGDADLRHLAEATDDFTPVHFDDAAPARTHPDGRVAHGTQTLHSRRPVRPGDAVTVRLEALEVAAAERRVRLSTVCTTQHGKVVLDGEAWVEVLA